MDAKTKISEMVEWLSEFSDATLYSEHDCDMVRAIRAALLKLEELGRRAGNLQAQYRLGSRDLPTEVNGILADLRDFFGEE